MTERAALYTVAVHSRRGSGVPLDDIDGDGSSLADVLTTLLDGLSETSRDGTRVVRALSATRDGDDLFAIVQHGSRGVAADIVDAAGGVRLRQTPDDLQLVRFGCLFRLPAGVSSGLLAVHIANGRGAKSLFEQGLSARFRDRFPQLSLVLDPLAEPDALRRAVADGRVEKVRLVRLEPAGTRVIAETEKWVPVSEAARIELDVAVRSPAAGIQPALLQRYLDGDAGAFTEIVSFEGMTFDQALVGVLLPDRTRRLFDLARPRAGRPLTRALTGIVSDAAGEPTEASLLAALRAALIAAD